MSGQIHVSAEMFFEAMAHSTAEKMQELRSQLIASGLNIPELALRIMAGQMLILLTQEVVVNVGQALSDGFDFSEVATAKQSDLVSWLRDQKLGDVWLSYPNRQ